MVFGLIINLIIATIWLGQLHLLPISVYEYLQILFFKKFILLLGSSFECERNSVLPSIQSDIMLYCQVETNQQIKTRLVQRYSTKHVIESPFVLCYL